MQYLKFGNMTLTALDGVSSFEERSGYSFAEQAIASGKPILQGMGETLSTVTLNIILRQSLGHDITNMLKLVSECRKAGKPERLVFANGTYQGDYLITEVVTTVLRTTSTGEILAADLVLNLKEFADRVVISQRNAETRPAGKKSNRKITEK